ncbi:asparaginase [Pusillimonas caeni]|uniref:asparaginase n=1 Tax=Pusillimonas caeni TaxID=1348472 RepID=UPI000E59A709|nr:asparaginase [Pusillimonas caeni]TFL14992.1 asparaginase [Pusillimonas caeni]
MSNTQVQVIVLGGTITMTSTPEGGVAPSLAGEALMQCLPALRQIADVTVETPFLKPGASLTYEELKGVVQSARAAAQRGFAGTVVVQGTDTIDESSFFCDLLHEGEEPIVFTGAMRNASSAGADGPANLLAAISVAAAPRARGMGVLVTLNDEIHLARAVEKMHKGLPSAFQTLDGGPVGYFNESTVEILRRPVQRFHLPAPEGALPPVAVIKVGMDDSTALLEAAADLGYAGLVVEAMGAGHVPAHFVEPLGRLAGRMPVVLASRVAGGRIFRNTYHFPGSEMGLIEQGLIPAGWLSPHKARILLGACAACGLDRTAIVQAFGRYS